MSTLRPDSNTPTVDALILDTMRRYPSERGLYYVQMHQALAPLARDLERHLRAVLSNASAQAIAEARAILSGAKNAQN